MIAVLMWFYQNNYICLKLVKLRFLFKLYMLITRFITLFFIILAYYLNIIPFSASLSAKYMSTVRLSFFSFM